jgi:hypothetical protein
VARLRFNPWWLTLLAVPFFVLRVLVALNRQEIVHDVRLASSYDDFDHDASAARQQDRQEQQQRIMGVLLEAGVNPTALTSPDTRQRQVDALTHAQVLARTARAAGALDVAKRAYDVDAVVQRSDCARIIRAMADLRAAVAALSAEQASSVASAMASLEADVAAICPA